MGVLGGILLLVGVILFFIGLMPLALFIGFIGVLFAVMGNGNGTAKGFGGGYLVVLAILAASAYFFYNVFIEEENVSHAKTYPIKQTAIKQTGNLFWEHLDDGGYRVWVKGLYAIRAEGNSGDWKEASLVLRRQQKDGKWQHEVYVCYGSKVVPKSCKKGAFQIRNDSNWEDSCWTWQNCSCSTDNTAIFFNDNSPNDNEDDVINLLNAMNGKQYFAAVFEDHRGRWFFAKFNIMGHSPNLRICRKA